MSKKVTIRSGLRVYYKGMHDYDGFYKMMRAWFKKRNYKFIEKIYKSKKSGPDTYDAEFIIYAEKKITEYIRYEINLQLKFIAVKEYEVKEGNTIKKYTNGRAELKILSADVVFDYQNKFNGSTFFGLINYSTLQDFVVDTLLETYYDFNYYAPLESEILDFHKSMKAYLDMESA